MVDIATEAAPYSGTPRAAANQYIQDAIDGESAGTTFNLLTGTHRGQNILLKAGDTMILNTGAVLNGTEDIGVSGWTVDSTEWKKTVQAGDIQYNGSTPSRAGYDAESLEYVIIDKIIRTWVTTQAAVDAFSAYYDGTDIFIGVDPSTVDTIEIARARSIGGVGGNHTLRGESPAERALIYGYAADNHEPGPGGIWMKGDGSLFRDLEIAAFSADALVLWENSETYNVTVRGCGHLNIMAHNDTDGITPNVVVGEGVWIIDGGVGGFESGHEGGNSKWFGTVDLRIKGALFDFGGHPHKDGQGPLWLDINDDGYHIFGNIVRDLDHGGKRGLFVETCYSGKIYDNICYELGWAGESDFWGNGIIISTAGPDLANSEYLTIEIHHNLLYHCAGGVHLVGNRDTSPEFWHRWGFPYVHDIDVHHNTTVFAGSAFAGWTEPVGVTVADQFGTVENCFYENNVYLVDADSGRFTDEQDGGGGNGMDFNDWQTTGVTQDTTGDLVVAGGYDADPFNGGAM